MRKNSLTRGTYKSYMCIGDVVNNIRFLMELYNKEIDIIEETPEEMRKIIYPDTSLNKLKQRLEEFKQEVDDYCEKLHELCRKYRIEW